MQLNMFVSRANLHTAILSPVGQDVAINISLRSFPCNSGGFSLNINGFDILGCINLCRSTKKCLVK